jgi:hypothetical protein
MSKVRDQFSANAPTLENVFQQATAAIARAKEAVGLQVSSKAKARAKAPKATKRAIPVQKKAALEKLVNAPTAKTAKKSAPVKKAAKKRRAKKALPAAVAQAATTNAAAQ